MNRVITLLASFSVIVATSFAQNQPANFMPFAVGNRWTYSYSTYDNDELQEISSQDSGTAVVRVLARSATADSIVWEFQESRNIIHNVYYYHPPVFDTMYTITDTIEYYVVEYLSGNHRFFRKGTSNWTSVFLMTLDFSDSAAFFRYSRDESGDTLKVHTTWHSETTMPFAVLDVSFVKSQGPATISYEEPYITSLILHSRYVLKDAFVTTVEYNTTPRLPSKVRLEQNYPNPFNPSTTIQYSLPLRSRVTLSAFNTLGQLIATLVDGTEEAGYHEARFDATGLASGVYFYRLRAGEYEETKKLIILR